MPQPSSSWTLTWNHFLSKLGQMGSYSRSLGLPTHAPCVFSSIYGAMFSWSDYAASDPLERACLCFFTWVSSHLHGSFPVPVCSWHIFSPNSFLWFILPWSFFSTGAPHVIIIILLLGCILSDGNERRWGKWARKFLFPVRDSQGGKQHEKSSC